MNQKLIEQLRNGDIALQNSGTFEQLKSVLLEAFPQDVTLNYTHASYKYFCSTDGRLWQNSNRITSVPCIFISDFFKEETTEFVWGEEIEVQQGTWKKSIYLCPFPDKTLVDCHVVTGPMGGLPSVFKRSKLRKPKPVLELTLQEIADKFGKSVDQIRIKK